MFWNYIAKLSIIHFIVSMDEIFIQTLLFLTQNVGRIETPEELSVPPVPSASNVERDTGGGGGGGTESHDGTLKISVKVL